MKSTYFAALFLIITAATPLSAQRRVLSGADSVLVGRILLAEDRRDSTDAALALGQRHADTRVRLLAVRAAARTRDSAFATRDSLPPLREPKKWPNVAWRARYRSLKSQGDDCTAIRAALADRAWPVRLRGADLVTTNVAHFPMFADLRPPYPHCGSTKCAPVRAVDRWARPAAREGRSGEAIR